MSVGIRRGWAPLAGVVAGVLAGVIGSVALADVPRHNPFRDPDILPGIIHAPGTDSRSVYGDWKPELRATLVGGSAPMALVGERLMSIGDEINGFVLRAVHEGRAEFERAGQRLDVRLAPPGSGNEAEELTDE